MQFLQKKVVYLGHVIDADGLHPDKERVRATTKAPNPKNVSELKSFLGLLQWKIPVQPINSLNSTA